MCPRKEGTEIGRNGWETPMFIISPEVLFGFFGLDVHTTVIQKKKRKKSWEAPKYLSVDKQLNKKCLIHTVEYIPLFRKIRQIYEIMQKCPKYIEKCKTLVAKRLLSDLPPSQPSQVIYTL